jgi:hypothetical protein
MKRTASLLWTAGCLLAAASCSLFDPSTAAVKRYALVYGMTNYVTYDNSVDVNNPNLTYPAKDAVSMTSLLETRGYVVKSRWVDENGAVWVDGAQVGSLAGDASGAPNEATLQADLASIGAPMGSNDVFLFYFSGHGTTDDAGTHQYFVPYGGVVKVDGYYTVNMDGCVSDAEMGAYLVKAIPSSRRVVILDTCYSGGFISNSLEVDTIPQDTTSSAVISYSISSSTIAKAIANYAGYAPSSSSGIAPNVAQVISACGSAELSYEGASYGHGVMTYYLLNTVSGADLNGDGSVTALEWYSLVKAGIEEDWDGRGDIRASRETFLPHVSGGPVDFVVF